MRRFLAPLGWASAVLVMSGVAFAQQEIVVSIQVHGNTLTPDEEIIRASGLSPGAPFSDRLLTEAKQQLESLGRFDRVDVVKRFASITDPSQVLVLIRVDEGPVRIVIDSTTGQAPHPAPRGKFNVMFVPLLDAEDGYGLTYGARIAVARHASTTSRVVFPLSWGGDKRAGGEFQKEFAPRLAPRIVAGAFIQRRTHPFFRSDADRTRIFGRGEWQIVRPVRAGTTVAWQQATLLHQQDKTRSVGADITLDTRVDPLMPRNAVHAVTAIERLAFSTMQATRTELDASAYIGLYGGSVLVLRGVGEHFNRPVPAYFKPILGGSRNLRGFRAGTAIGDTIVAGSAEVRLPLTSPLHLAAFGTSVFLDAGAAYDNGYHLKDQTFMKGIGGGVWMTAPLFRLSLMVAHGIGAGTRAHFGAGLTF